MGRGVCVAVFFAAVFAAGVVGAEAAGGAAASTAVAAPTATPQAATMEVKIDNFSFGPTEVKVAVGTTVTWTNRDDIPHTVVSNDKLFKSKVLDTDEKFSFTFTKAGTYEYFCSIHPHMTGRVVVR
jgi:amicyanin